ncbi:MAG: hypothetical protein M3450_01325, partial [Actinomycetota bacterium]|nr:hypothetical protein [Actinomycetota bacterium]
LRAGDTAQTEVFHQPLGGAARTASQPTRTYSRLSCACILRIPDRLDSEHPLVPLYVVIQLSLTSDTPRRIGREHPGDLAEVCRFTLII